MIFRVSCRSRSSGRLLNHLIIYLRHPHTEEDTEEGEGELQQDLHRVQIPYNRSRFE